MTSPYTAQNSLAHTAPNSIAHYQGLSWQPIQLHASATQNIPAIPCGYLYTSRTLTGDNGYRIFHQQRARLLPSRAP